MGVVPVVIAALVLVLFQVHLRSRYPEYANMLAVVFVVVVLLQALGPLRDIFGVFNQLGREAGLSGTYFNILLRTIALAYITAFGSQLCRDAEENSIAVTVEFVGKIIIIIVALPIIVGIVEVLVSLLP